MNERLKSIFNRNDIVNSIIVLLVTLIILEILDINNVFSALLKNNNWKTYILVIVCVIVLIIVYGYKKGIHNLFRSKNIISIEMRLLAIAVAFIIIGIYRLLSGKDHISIIMVAISGIYIACFLGRIIYVLKCKKTTTKPLLELIDIINNNFVINENELVLLSESDVNYDILDRGTIVSNFSNIIKSNLNADHSISIGLEGKWGSGKTTIINLVRSKLDDDSIVIIDDFVPWHFGTEESFVRGMYETILKKTGIITNISNYRASIRILLRTVGGINSTAKPFTSLLLDKESDYSSYISLKKELDNLLSNAGKTFIFVIDNIERANADNIILLFRLIGTVFDLPNIVYVLSYDKKRLEEVFKDVKKINPSYVEKIINPELHVPSISNDTLTEIYGICITNLARKYGLDDNEIGEFKSYNELISQRVTNLRQFKRLLNSVIIPVLARNTILNKKELLFIETIRFLDIDLYDSIFANRQFFVSHNRTPKDAFFANFNYNKDKFNQNAKDYFDKLFEEKDEYRLILSELFPYVDRYNDGKVLEDTRNADKSDKEIRNRSAICSNKYFDLYFSSGINDDYVIRKYVEKAIKSFGKESSDSFVDVVNKIIQETPDNQMEWMIDFQNQLNRLPLNEIRNVIDVLWAKIKDFSDENPPFMLSAKQRALAVIQLLLERIDEKEGKEYINRLKSKYDYINEISDVDYWFKSSNSNTASSAVKECWHNMYESMCESIIIDNIDLYNDDYYSKSNIYGLSKAYLKEDDLKFTNYMKEIYKSCNIFRFLGDIINISESSQGYIYEFKSDNITKFGLSDETIEKDIKKKEILNSDEKFLIDVFNKYKNDEKDIWGRCSVVVGTRRLFDSL